jgi:hypothetical protein
MALVLKTRGCKSSVGSNPTLSAIFRKEVKMKRYEGCSGVSGWIISHLGWFIVIGIMTLFVFILKG